MYINDFSIEAGETMQVSINLDNSTALSAFQLELHLPAGLTMALDNRGRLRYGVNADRADDHTLTFKDRGNGQYNATYYSTNSYDIYDNSGEVVYFYVSAAEDFSGTATISLKEIYVSDAAGNMTQLDNTTCTVTGPTPVDPPVTGENTVFIDNFQIGAGETKTVTLTDGTTYPAALIGTDEQTDVALLWIDAGDRELTVAAMGASYDLVVGEDIIAIGNPLGSLGGTVTEGIVSATARSILVDGSAMTLLQVSCPISPGNSGGGLFDLYGKLIGIVNAKSSDTSAEGLGFAIPVDYAYSIITQLLDYGYVKGIVDTGLTVRYLNEINAMFNNLINAGLYIVSSEYSDELKNADRIISINGYSVNSESDYKSIIRAYNVGDSVTIRIGRVERNGRELREKEYEFQLELHEYIPEAIISD